MVPDEDRKHLFGRFQEEILLFRVSLGLNIVAKYVEIMNGTIDFESKLGEGTTFTIDFKLDEAVLPNEKI